MNFQNCSQILFCDKVQTIRDHLDKPLSEVNQDSPYAHDNQFSGCPSNSFTPISENSLRKIILQCAPKTCELNAIPTSLFFKCLDAILPTLTVVVNHSLLTGEFVPMLSDLEVTLDSSFSFNWHVMKHL